MNLQDWLIRFGLAVVAALTFLGGNIPDGVGVEYLSTMPLKTWVFFIVNFMAGLFSPTAIKAIVPKKVQNA